MKENDQPLLITYEDLVRIAKKHRRFLVRAALFSAAFGLIFSLAKPLKYKAVASFKEASAQPIAASLSQFFNSTATNTQENSALFMMQSDQVLQKVAEKLGLQVQVNDSLSNGVFRNIGDNLKYSFLGKVSEDTGFEFTEVKFAGETERRFILRFDDEMQFICSEKNENRITHGKIGEEVCFSDFSFVVSKAPENLKQGKEYRVTLLPFHTIVGSLRCELEIRPDKKDRQILWLLYAHRSRAHAAKLVNQLGASFLDYLTEENLKLEQAQLQFLDERRIKLELDFDQTLNRHVKSLSENVSKSGFIAVSQQVEMLMKPQQELQERFIDLCSLEGSLKEVQASYASMLRLPLRPKKDLVAEQGGGLSAPWLFDKTQFWPEQFAGIDLDTAKELHAGYQRNLDNIEAQIDRIEFLLPRMKQENFELNALSSLAQDEITASMARQASTLALSLREEGNYSQKDLFRLGESLKSQKKFIEAHLGQSLDLCKQQARVIQSKLAMLRGTMLKLITTNKEMLQEQMGHFQQQLSDIPERWRVEKQIEVRSGVMQKVVEGMAQVIEGKMIEHHMKNINSKMIDSARPATSPSKHHPLYFMGFFAFLALVCAYLFFLVKTVWRGIPLSLASAASYGLPTIGRLSFFRGAAFDELPKQDLETMRKAIDFIESNLKPLEGVTVALVGNDQKGLSNNLAQLLTWQKKTILIVDLSFSQRIPKDVEEGLWHFLQGKTEEWKVIKKIGYDFLPSGATTRFATELMRVDQFDQFLDQAKQRYERIFLVSETPLDASETQLLLQKADLGIVVIDQEPYELLAKTRITTIAKQKDKVTLVFKEG